MGLIDGITSFAGKVIDKVAPDKAESRRQQAEINRAELEGAPVSRLRLWRSLLGCALSLCLIWEVMIRPVIVTYWPEVTLPPSMLHEVQGLIFGMLGLGF